MSVRECAELLNGARFGVLADAGKLFQLCGLLISIIEQYQAFDQCPSGCSKRDTPLSRRLVHEVAHGDNLTDRQVPSSQPSIGLQVCVE